MLVVKLSQYITSLARKVESVGVTEDHDGWMEQKNLNTCNVSSVRGNMRGNSD